MSIIQQAYRASFGVPGLIHWHESTYSGSGKRYGGLHVCVPIFNRHHSTSVVKQENLAPETIICPHTCWWVPESQTNVFSLPFWLVPRDISPLAAPCLSFNPAQSLIHCIFPVLCGGRKRVVLIEPLLDLSNLGNLRRQNPASLPLSYPVGTCLLKEVISSCGCLPGPVMRIRTESLQFYRNYSISHQ